MHFQIGIRLLRLAPGRGMKEKVSRSGKGPAVVNDPKIQKQVYHVTELTPLKSLIFA